MVLQLKVVNTLDQFAQLHLVSGGLAAKTHELLVLVAALVLELVQRHLGNAGTLGNGVHQRWQRLQHLLGRLQLRGLGSGSGLRPLDSLAGLGNLCPQSCCALTLNAQTLYSSTQLNANVQLAVALLLEVVSQGLTVLIADDRSNLRGKLIVRQHRLGQLGFSGSDALTSQFNALRDTSQLCLGCLNRNTRTPESLCVFRESGIVLV